MTAADHGLLRAVLADPADDLPRLACADWLEERGRVGDAERAEFVRVQLALAKAPDGLCKGFWVHSPDCPDVRECNRLMHARDRLRHRASDLLDVALPPDGTEAGAVWAEPLPTLGVGVYDPWYRRGFIHSVTLPLDAFLAHAEAVFSWHPVSEVTLSDLGPQAGYGGWCWHVGSDVDAYAAGSVMLTAGTLPYELFLLVPGECARAPGGDRSPLLGVKCHGAREAADAALSAACVSWGRSLAGLGPLPAE